MSFKPMKKLDAFDWLLLIAMVFAAFCLHVKVYGATVNVRDFGAVPDDGKDDIAAFEAARNAAGTGGIITVPAGQFDVSRQFDPGASRAYIGVTSFHCENWNTARNVPLKFIMDKTSTIHPMGDFHAFRVMSSSIAIKALTFDGRGIWVENSAIAVDKLTVDGCWFKLNNITTGDHKSAVQFQTWLTNSSITNSVFDPIMSEVGIYGYRWSTLTIANNAFMNGVEGIHLPGNSAPKALLIQQNYYAKLSRMGTELQGEGWDSVVEDNWYESPKAYTADTFAYSVVADQSVNARVRRNVQVSPKSADTPDKIGVRILFELGGKDFICEDNYSQGGNHVVGVNGANATGVVRNNKLIDYREAPRNANGATATFTNNTPSVTLTWDIARGKPGPFRRYGEPLPPIVVQDKPATQPTTSTASYDALKTQNDLLMSRQRAFIDLMQKGLETLDPATQTSTPAPTQY